VLVTVFHALAFISTTPRLWLRYRVRRIWWDDIWTALSLCCYVICLGCGRSQSRLRDPTNLTLSLRSKHIFSRRVLNVMVRLGNCMGARTMSRQSHVASC
ncbi:hypothetical protein BV22DRAFT_1023840, partial [Leucogyrophana mollusca]